MNGFDFTEPDDIDFANIQAEIHTNLIAPMAFVKRYARFAPPSASDASLAC